MEFEELVSREIQSLESLHATECFEDDGRAAHVWHRGEEVAGQVQVLQVLKVEHVVRQLLQIVRCQVELFQINAMVKVTNAFEVQLVV